MTKTFTGDNFAAYNQAIDWTVSLGYSHGSMQRGAPTALFKGDCYISKWRNLSSKERGEADGRIEGDFLNGPVTVTLKAAAEMEGVK